MYGHKSRVTKERVLTQVQAAEIFVKSLGVTLRDKVCSCESHETLNVESLLPIERSQLFVSKMPRKDRRGGFCGLNQNVPGKTGEASPGVLLAAPPRKLPRCPCIVITNLKPCLVLSWCGPAEL